MSKKRRQPYVLKSIEFIKFVPGGQTLGYAKAISEGDERPKPIFAWGVLPGEVADVLITKSRRGILEGVVESAQVIKRSPHRIEPANENEYLSTSPWQIVEYGEEQLQKLGLLRDIFQKELNLDLESLAKQNSFELQYINPSAGTELGYRNKMEYNFWGDDEGINLALHRRGTGQKLMLEGSVLASEAINKAGRHIIAAINKMDVRASDLKSIILRSNQKAEVVAALYIKRKNFPKIELSDSGIKGLICYFSEPRSPASVPTEELYQTGELQLVDDINGVDFTYDVESFFQIRPDIMGTVVNDISKELDKIQSANDVPLVDFYGGVGTLGILLVNPQQELKIVELDSTSATMAKVNIDKLELENAAVECLSAEESLSKIEHKSVLIVDPPRAGLHKKVVQSIAEAKPKLLVYLSCNPVTQARDLGPLLDAGYNIRFIRGYNFFPRTPHLECLIILQAE